MTDPRILGSRPLALSDVVAISRQRRPVAVAGDVRRRLSATRTLIESQWMRDDARLIYSFNTGVGVFKNTRISVRESIPARVDGDVWYAADMGAALNLLQSGKVLKACESIVGRIE